VSGLFWAGQAIVIIDNPANNMKICFMIYFMPLVKVTLIGSQSQ